MSECSIMKLMDYDFRFWIVWFCFSMFDFKGCGEDCWGFGGAARACAEAPMTSRVKAPFWLLGNKDCLSMYVVSEW